MAGNPKDSPWYSTPRASRKRRPLEVTLSEEARAKLEALVKKRGGSKSSVLEDLILAAR